MFIEILFKMLLFKGGELIYAEHCIYIYIYTYKPFFIKRVKNSLQNNKIKQRTKKDLQQVLCFSVFSPEKKILVISRLQRSLRHLNNVLNWAHVC